MVQLIKRWLSYAVFGRQSYRFTNKKILGFRQLQTGPINFGKKLRFSIGKYFLNYSHFMFIILIRNHIGKFRLNILNLQ